MSKVVGYIKASEKLIQEMRDRFAYITDPSGKKFEPIYVIATALDPRFRRSLDHNQLEKAKKEILKQVKL